MNASAVVVAIALAVPSFARRGGADAATYRAKLMHYACMDNGVNRCSFVWSIAMHESGYRLRNASAPLAGCRPYSLDDWQQATCAARAWRLATSRCGDERAAVARYRSGECRVSRRGRRASSVRSYVSSVLRLASRIERGVR